MDKFKKLGPGTKLKVGSHECIILNYLNEGGFAHIYKVQIIPEENGSDIACLKRVLVRDKMGLNQLRTEVKVMQKLIGCPNIVQYYDSHASRISSSDKSEKFLGYEVLVLMELCPNRSLLDFMNTRLKTKLTEGEILKIMYDISMAVVQLHYLPKPLIHRDIKIENVLIDSHRNFKLCDFGSTCHVMPPAKTPEEFEKLYNNILQQTTPQYRCPEMIDLSKGLPIDEKSDIWALGVFLYKLCYYTTPFETHGQAAIVSASFQFPPTPRYSQSLKNLIIIMLQANPDYRPNIYQVMDAVCKITDTKNPISDKYNLGAYKIPQLPTQTQTQPQPQPQQSQPQTQLQPSPPVSAGSAGKSANARNVHYSNIPSAGQFNTFYGNNAGANSSNGNNGNSDIKSLTQTLLQTTTEMIEDSPKLTNKNESFDDRKILEAQKRFPPVELSSNSNYNPPLPDKLSTVPYPLQDPDFTSFASFDSGLAADKRSTNDGHGLPYFTEPSNTVSPNVGINMFYGSSSTVNVPSENSHLPISRQPSMKSKTSKKTGSRPSSYIESQQQSYLSSSSFNAVTGPSGSNQTNRTDFDNGLMNTGNITTGDETSNDIYKNSKKENYSNFFTDDLLDFDDLDDLYSGPIVSSQQQQSQQPQQQSQPQQPQQQSVSQHQPQSQQVSQHANPWAGASNSSPFPSLPGSGVHEKPEFQINDLLLQTKNIVQDMIDKEEKTPRKETFDAQTLSTVNNYSPQQFNNSFKHLSIEPAGQNYNLLDIESPKSNGNSFYSQNPRSASKIRELVNKTAEIEVDLSSDSSNEEEIVVEEEDAEKYLAKVRSKNGNSSNSKSDPQQSKVPRIVTSVDKNSTTIKPSPTEGVNPVDLLFAKEEPKRSKRNKLKLGHRGSDSSYSPENSPISADTKKKFSNIFGDNEDEEKKSRKGLKSFLARH